MSSLLAVIARHAFRSLRGGGFPMVFATLMVAVGAWALGSYATVVVNLERVGRSVGRSVAAVAFLDVDSAADAEEVRATFALDPRVAEARLVNPDEALARARRALGEAGRALEGSSGIRMPWVVEVIPRIDVTEPEGGARSADTAVSPLLASLRATPGVEDVMHPSGDMGRVEALLRMLHGGGLLLGGLFSLVVLVVISSALRIAVSHRREEIAVSKLVGATDFFVCAPFFLSGFVQGTAGALLGVAGVAAAHASLVRATQDVFAGATGAWGLEPLPVWIGGLLVLGGGVLGMCGAGFAVRRFLRA